MTGRNQGMSRPNPSKEDCYVLDPTLFNIFVPFRNNKNRNEEAEVTLIQAAYDSLYELFTTRLTDIQNSSNSNCEARLLAKKFYDSNSNYPKNSFLGRNETDTAVLEIINEEKYLFPEKCSFYSYDIKNANRHLGNKVFHFILMDPPWWNKFIRRKRKISETSGYEMLHDDNLASIPVNNLLHDDGIIAIWCTSAPSHINAILTSLFLSWNVEFISQWYWLKITKFGKPICAFSPTLGKQPYERIIFGKKKGRSRKYPNPENNKVIMSIPSAIHSHKPPLCELIKPYIQENADCLELFARYLLPEWTSYGNEVLKLQHFSLYNQVLENADQEQN